MRSHYKIYDNDAPYFITSTVIEWIPIFTEKTYFEILLSSIQYCQENKKLAVYAYMILDNHFHMVCQAPNLSRVIQSLKRYSATTLIEQLVKDKKHWLLSALKYYKKRHKQQSEHQLWQEGFHPKQISNEKMLVQKIEYIHNNPVERGYVLRPEHWAYSSARDYLTDESGFIQLDNLFD